MVPDLYLTDVAVAVNPIDVRSVSLDLRVR